MTTNPARAAFEEDLEGPTFQRGLALGNWRLVRGGWPDPLMAVSAAPRLASPKEFLFLFDLHGYPTSAPTSQIWDEATKARLAPERRPWGSWNVQKAFRDDWPPGALYIPCDRLALESHNWSKMPGAWKQGHEISHYLCYVHALLNSPGYTGICSAAA